jgi:hypothetical protein
MLSLGIDIGYCAVKIALVDQHGRVRLGRYRAHRGQPGQALRALLEDCARAGLARSIATAAAVGNGAELLARTRAVSRVNEVAALVEGALLLAPQARGVIEIGAQTAKYLTEFSPQTRAGSGSPSIPIAPRERGPFWRNRCPGWGWPWRTTPRSPTAPEHPPHRRTL